VTGYCHFERSEKSAVCTKLTHYPSRGVPRGGILPGQPEPPALARPCLANFQRCEFSLAGDRDGRPITARVVGIKSVFNGIEGGVGGIDRGDCGTELGASIRSGGAFRSAFTSE
jgi:hypothetical protein